MNLTQGGAAACQVALNGLAQLNEVGSPASRVQFLGK